MKRIGSNLRLYILIAIGVPFVAVTVDCLVSLVSMIRGVARRVSLAPETVVCLTVKDVLVIEKAKAHEADSRDTANEGTSSLLYFF
jgi:hypothetical protein